MLFLIIIERMGLADDELRGRTNPPRRRFLCVIEVLPTGCIAALSVEAADALEAERSAGCYAVGRFGVGAQVLEVLPQNNAGAPWSQFQS
ncbi:MAG: hypothetical protein QOD92_3271 [Acidimicrobiaceae bacterium]|jgi:hypothetical protein